MRAQLGPKRQCDKSKDAPQLMHEAAEVSKTSLFFLVLYFRPHALSQLRFIDLAPGKGEM